MTDKELYYIYIDAYLEEHAVKCGIHPDIIDDLYTGFVGFEPGSNPLAAFTNDHGIKHNPANVEKILLELMYYTKQVFTFELFIEEKLDVEEILSVFKAKNSIKEVERMWNLRKLLFDEFIRKRNLK